MSNIIEFPKKFKITNENYYEYWKLGRENYLNKKSTNLFCRIFWCSPKKDTCYNISVMSYWGNLFICKRCNRWIAIDAWD